jgi:hypothetical protein
VTSDFQGSVLAFHSGRLYMTNSQGEIVSCPVGDCASPTPIDTGVYLPQALVVDNDGIYFTSYDGVYTCPLAGCGNQAARPIASGQASPSIIRTDSQFVYWVDQGGPGDGSSAFAAGTASIMRVAK